MTLDGGTNKRGFRMKTYGNMETDNYNPRRKLTVQDEEMSFKIEAFNNVASGLSNNGLGSSGANGGQQFQQGNYMINTGNGSSNSP